MSLSRRARALVALAWGLGAAAGVWTGLATCASGSTELFEKGGASEDALRRRVHLVRGLRAGVLPDHIALDSAQFQGEYALGTWAMGAYALTNIALDAPETAPEAQELLDLCIAALRSGPIAEFDRARWGAHALDELDRADRGHIAYLGHLGLVLGARRLLDPNAPDEPFHRRVVEGIAARLALHPHRHAETYPGETYTMDTLVAYAALRAADRTLGTDHRELVREWITWVRGRLLDPTTGLIVFGVNKETGAPLQGGRGSAAGWASFFLPLVDRELAREQWEATRTHLAGTFGPLAGVREWHPSDPMDGHLGDIDSGPVLVWGVSATGFSQAGARRAGDLSLFLGLRRTAELFGITLDDGDARRYSAAPLLGDAILLAMSTARPWWDE